jgi:hypothetical protein
MHPKTERVTVISGVFASPWASIVRLRKVFTGTYGFWPAGMRHAAWIEGETVVQLHGMGRGQSAM